MSVEAAHKDNIPVLDKQLQSMALAGISPQLKRHEMLTETEQQKICPGIPEQNPDQPTVGF